MDLNPYFKSIIEQDTAAVVICDLDHRVIYMNPADIASHDGKSLVGQSLLDCHNEQSVARIRQVVDWFRADQRHNRVFIAHREKYNRDQYMVALRDAQGALIGYYEKHEYRTAETMPLYDLYE